MLSGLFRALCHVAGVDHDRIQSCALGDKQFATRIGLQLLFSSTFLFSIFASSLLIGFGDDVVSDMIVIAMAFITAVVVLLVDTQIVQSDFYYHGLELARDRGLDDATHRWAKIKRPALVALRLTLSMVIAFAFATFFELRLFGADIKSQIEADYQRANGSLFQEVEADYDANVRLTEGEISREETALFALNRREDEVRGRLFKSDIDGELVMAVQKVEQLAAAKKTVDQEAFRREGDAVNELNGIRETADQSGLKGTGSRYRAATERAVIARQESTRLAAEIVRVQAQITTLRERRERELDKSNAAVTAELGELDREASETRSRLDGTKKRREQEIAGREGSVFAIAQARPEYKPKPEGFLVRVEALETLKENRAVARIALWTTLVIMLVEVSAVLGKVFFSTPTLYAVRTALEFESAVYALVRDSRIYAQEAEVDTLRKDIDLEELRNEFAAQRACRFSKEAAMHQLYQEHSDNRRSVS